MALQHLLLLDLPDLSVLVVQWLQLPPQYPEGPVDPLVLLYLEILSDLLLLLPLDLPVLLVPLDQLLLLRLLHHQHLPDQSALQHLLL